MNNNIGKSDREVIVAIRTIQQQYPNIKKLAALQALRNRYHNLPTGYEKFCSAIRFGDLFDSIGEGLCTG